MISKTTIICFGEDLGGNPFSKFHIMKRLASTNHIIYVESIGVRTPTLSGRDVQRILRKLDHLIRRTEGIVTSASSQDPQPFLVIKPMVLPFHRWSLIRWLNAQILIWQIKRCRPSQPIILWVGLPTVPAQLLRIQPGIVIYHCADKLVANASGADRATLERLHHFWLQRADLTLTPSEVLRAELSKYSDRVQLLPHGLDYDHFAQASNADVLPCPDDIAAIPSPIAGYFGTVSAEWFNVEMMCEVVAARPNVSFVLIGPIYDNINHHPGLKRPNVHFLGPRPYQQLPDYVSRFDVCMIPKVRSEMTVASMPLKLREYLATGKPIITTLQHGDPYDRYVSTVHTAEAFVSALDEAITEDDSELRRARQLIIEHEGWDDVVEQLSDKIASLICKEG